MRSENRKRLTTIREKLSADQPLSFDDGVFLYREPNLLELGSLANDVRERLHGDQTSYVGGSRQPEGVARREPGNGLLPSLDGRDGTKRGGVFWTV